MSDLAYERLAIWSQIAASVAFIILLVYVWNAFIAPAVLKAQAQKNAELDAAEQRRDAARRDVEAAHHELLAAEHDARAIVERAASDAGRIHERIVSDAHDESARLMHHAEGELERGRAAAREQLRAELLEKALEIARASASRLDAGTNDRLVGDAVTAAERADGR